MQSIRNFASTKSAKVLMGIIIIPFVMWGMGDVFRGGNKNTVATINKEKITTDNFVEYLNSLGLDQNYLEKNLESDLFQKILMNLVNQKLIALESEKLGINISKESLAKIIKNDSNFKKENKFSRSKYEKFLISSNMTATQFEANLLIQEKKRLLFEFIGNGIKSPEFLVNEIYDSKNKKMEIEILNLEDVYDEKIKISDLDIKNYFEKNEKNFEEEFKIVKYAEINPKSLVGEEDFNNLFFDKLDEIEDLIADSYNIEQISNKFKLEVKTSEFLNEKGFSKEGVQTKTFGIPLLNEIFKIEKDLASLFKNQNNYILVQVLGTKNVLPDIKKEEIKSKIKNTLKIKKMFEMINKIIKEINQKKFTQNNMKKMAIDGNTKIQKITLNNYYDDKNLKKSLIKKIYKITENNIAVVIDDELNNIYMVHVNKISSKKIQKSNSDYFRYLLESNLVLRNKIYKTYDDYMAKKYEVIINYQTLDRIKNYYR